MKQLQFAYVNPEHLGDVLQNIARFRGNRQLKLLFHIYSEQPGFRQLKIVCSAIVKFFPDALCVGCSGNGNIVDGAFSGESVTVTCSVFEDPATRIEVLQYVLKEESAEPIAEDLAREVGKRPWVSAVEMLAATPGFSFTGFCNGLSTMRPEVQVFGGLAGQTCEETPAYVFSNVCDFSNESVVCVLYGGENFHVETVKVSGWKPLGRPFTVTKAQGNVLHELDGKPAFEAFSKYLNIQNDYYFFQNTLEFPLFYNEDGENLLRCPMACSENGALLLASDMGVGIITKLAYGDPQSIMDSVRLGTTKLSKFCPDAIYMYSGMGRRMFWGETDVNNETVPFDTIAPASGFYAAAQFLRTRNFVKLHNLSIVVVGMREGEADTSKMKTAVVNDDSRAGRVSVITRLANFTNVSSAELVEMYNMMTKNSITDALTGLYNRGEIQRRIAERHAENPDAPMSLVMIDIDNFKSVNDTYGHKIGDIVIQGLSKQIQIATYEKAPDADAGRWGGEDFMIMLPDMGIKEAVEFAETVRTGFAQVMFPEVGRKTISLGATEMRWGDSIDAICVRVDEALYKAKNSGKNRVVTL